MFAGVVLDRGFPEHALDHVVDARRWLRKAAEVPADVAAELAALEDRARRAGGRASS